MSYYVGLDIGGTSIKAGLVSKGKILSKAVVKTQTRKGTKAVFRNILDAIDSVKTKDISGIGVGCPGPLDYKKGVIINSPNVPLKNFKICSKLKKRFNTKVLLDNDVNCFALGETLYGSGKDFSFVVGVTLGTGVGGAIVLDKKIYHGRSNAGEFGHMTIKYDGEYSKCGNTGCFETMCSARGILRIAGLKGLKVRSPKEIYDLATNKDKVAKKVFEEYGEYLGIGLTNIIYALDPKVIIIGGNISLAWKYFSKSMKKSISKRCMFEPSKVLKSELRFAGIIGAASLF
ncbi:MAG: N-acetyl-D-glucosamine kinase [Candidatus Woesearchaeota archaeon]|nr:N-acetyl-D-glucosamine kinase [Candidatus Woesearchaeota archaeon]